jgi:uncharacterized membrane protein YeaQ/YmgE (transglycosylase-associated protein family)
VSLIVFIILLFVQGLIIGAFARLALPGRDPLSIWQTAAVGIAGSFVAGLLVYAISGGRQGAGFLAGLVVSTIIMYFIRRSRGGGLTDPGVPGGRRGDRARTPFGR